MTPHDELLSEENLFEKAGTTSSKNLLIDDLYSLIPFTKNR